MSGGGLMQLAAKSAQDMYLTNNPQITLFKAVYHRHTNFARDIIEQSFNETISSNSQVINSIISKSDSLDLLSNLYLKVTLPGEDISSNVSYQNWTNNTGHAFIKTAEFFMGSSLIEKHTGTWLDIYNELTDVNEDEYIGLNKHNAKNSYLMSQNSLDALKLYIPFKFWFCRNPGTAIPLCALRHQDLRLRITTRGVHGLVNCDKGASNLSYSPSSPTVKLYAEYIQLDTEERRRFAKSKHEFLIEQVQNLSTDVSGNTGQYSANIQFSHPVKALFWVLRDDTAKTEITSTTFATSAVDAAINVQGTDKAQSNDYFNYTSKSSNASHQEVISGQTSNELFSTATVLFNASERFVAQDASYFRIIEPLRAGFKVPQKHIYMYSFALSPNKYEPSGTANFSKIDRPKLRVTISATTADTLDVYALNYNILRVTGGKGALGYAS
jgi:hypothetical protein